MAISILPDSQRPEGMGFKCEESLVQMQYLALQASQIIKKLQMQL